MAKVEEPKALQDIHLIVTWRFVFICFELSFQKFIFFLSYLSMTNKLNLLCSSFKIIFRKFCGIKYTPKENQHAAGTLINLKIQQVVFNEFLSTKRDVCPWQWCVMHTNKLDFVVYIEFLTMLLRKFNWNT